MELFFILYILQNVEGYFKTVNHSIAQIECEEYGGLFSYTDFDKHDRTVAIRGDDSNAMTLAEGESAWIQGYADYSTILSWFGCYNIQKQYVNNSKNIPENTEYSCSKYCVMKTSKTKYIALRANECFCFTIDDFISGNLDRCEYTQCQRSILNSADNTLNDVSNVFKIHNHAKMHWKQGSINSSSQQCVYAKIQDKEGRKSVSYETDLCFSSSKRGFICRNNFNLTLNETCNEYHEAKDDIPEICFTSEKTSWMEAENQCYEYKGKLIGEVFYSFRLYADTTQTYWTGMFRPFRVQNGSTSSSSCLSATRVKDTLVLDPDNCSNKKRFLCKDNFINITQIKVTTPSLTTSLLNTESTNKTTISATPRSTKPTTVETTVGIGIPLLLMVMLIILIIVYRVRTDKCNQTTDSFKLSNSNTPTQETECFEGTHSDCVSGRLNANTHSDCVSGRLKAPTINVVEDCRSDSVSGRLEAPNVYLASYSDCVSGRLKVSNKSLNSNSDLFSGRLKASYM